MARVFGTWVVAASLLACSASPTTPAAPSAATPPSSAHAAAPLPLPARPEAPAAMRLAFEDSRLLGYLDFARLARWKGNDGALWLLFQLGAGELEPPAFDCLTSAIRRHQPAVSFASRSSDEGRLERPVIVAELPEHEPARLLSCLRAALEDANEQPIEGLPTLRVGTFEDAPSYVATPRLFLLGTQGELPDAIGRSASLASPPALQATLPFDDDVVFAFAARDFDGARSMDGTVRIAGDALLGRLTLAFDEPAVAQRVQEKLGREREHMLRALGGPVLPSDHPLHRALTAITFDLDGDSVTIEARLPAYPDMEADLVARKAAFLRRQQPGEAANLVGAISRGALAAFEREGGPGPTPIHQLCKSAIDVPRDVPRGTRYLPNPNPGHDYETGDQQTGWRCLKFSLVSDTPYRLAYRQGSGYKGPARGGPDPGPNGFEASAEGDLDGDGVTSFFSIVGRIDPKTNTIVRSEIFTDLPDE